MILDTAVHRRYELRRALALPDAAQAIGQIVYSDDIRPRRKLHVRLIVVGDQLFDLLSQLAKQSRIPSEYTALDRRFAPEGQQIFDVPEGQLIGIDQLWNVAENIGFERFFASESIMFNAGRNKNNIAGLKLDCPVVYYICALTFGLIGDFKGVVSVPDAFSVFQINRLNVAIIISVIFMPEIYIVITFYFHIILRAEQICRIFEYIYYSIKISEML